MGECEANSSNVGIGVRVGEEVVVTESLVTCEGVGVADEPGVVSVPGEDTVHSSPALLWTVEYLNLVSVKQVGTFPFL